MSHNAESSETVKHVGAEIAAERAAALLLVEKLRKEAARINAEIDRLTHELTTTARLDNPKLD